MKYVSKFAVAIFFFLVGYLVLIPIEKYILENWLDVTPLAGTIQQEWLQVFETTGIYMLLIALLATFGWHVVGFLKYRILDWKMSGGKGVWDIFVVLMTFIILVTGFLITYKTQDFGRYLATIIYAFNGVLIFWLSSLLLSPSAVKYAPRGAMWVKGKFNF